MGLVVVIIVSRSLRRFVWLDIVLECRVGESETSSQTLPASDDMGKGSLLYSICATALLFRVQIWDETQCECTSGASTLRDGRAESSCVLLFETGNVG
jgi:hypothetical protein